MLRIRHNVPFDLLGIFHGVGNKKLQSAKDVGQPLAREVGLSTIVYSVLVSH